MKYKYIILFIIICGDLFVNKVFSQISVLIKAETLIPMANYSHEYNMGYGIGAGFTTQQLGRGTIAIHGTYNTLPGKSISDEYLSYKVEDLIFVPFNVEFNYMIKYNIHLVVEGGVVGYYKPEKAIGSNAAAGLLYKMGRLSVGGNIRHFRHNGYMNVLSGTIQYKLF